VRRLGLALAALAALVTLGALGACSNPETPAGFEGYVYHLPLTFGKMEYRGALKGPSSTGLSWRLYVENIDMRGKSFQEQFKLLTEDNLSVSFEVTTRIELVPGSVKAVVEDWGGKDWYEWNVKEPLRTVVRRQVVKVSATDIQLQTSKVGLAILQELEERYKGTPIHVLSVDIGHIEFPAEVTDAIQQKIAKEQELERQEFVLAKTRKEAAIRVLEALKAAKQQRIISSTLDPLYVQRRAVEVYRRLAASPNKTIMVLPTTQDGTGMPTVMTVGKQKIVGPADDAMLKEMEAKYMRVVGQAGEDDANSSPANALPGAAGVPPARTAPQVPAAPAPAPPGK
jgi:regulator of protease activity HflC (stomatin/prohibitin superfamily)